MANFKAQIESLSGAATDSEINQWMNDGAREIINILPSKLKQKCSKVTNLYISNSNTTMDLDAVGEILYVTRENADSGYYIGCREISPLFADSANDSSSLHYATATDPVYWTESNSSGNPTLFVLPTPTANQPAKIMHISYPDITASDVSIIANFPDEAEYLVVLYTAIKVLQNKMNEMNTNNDITTALGAITTEISKVDDVIAEANGKIDNYYTSIADIDDTTELWDNTNKRFKVVKDALDLAQNLIDNDQPNANYDAYANLGDIDSAMGAIDAHLTDGEAILTNDPTSGDINVALVAMKAALDQAEAAANKFEVADSDSIFGDENTFDTAASQLTNVKDALNNAKALFDTDLADDDGNSAESALYWLNDEDTEMVQATLQAAQTEIQRAQAEMQHWNAMGDMRVKEIQVALSEADGYSKEVQARLSYAKAYSEAAIARRAEGEGRIAQLNATVSVAGQELQRAQVAIAEINTLIASYKMELDGVPMYLQEAASYISQAQGYIGETKVRMERDGQKYQWYQGQQIKLQQDYDKGITMLAAQGIPKPQQREAK